MKNTLVFTLISIAAVVSSAEVNPIAREAQPARCNLIRGNDDTLACFQSGRVEALLTPAQLDKVSAVFTFCLYPNSANRAKAVNALTDLISQTGDSPECHTL